MMGYIVRRLLASIVVLFAVSIVVFALVRAQPGDVLLNKLRTHIPEEKLQRLRAELGMDRPLPEQYLDWIGGVVRGDLGHSMYREQETVWSRIQEGLPVTMELVFLAMVTSTVIGIPIGVLSAIRRNSPLDYLTRLFSVTGLAMPVFWLGTMVLVYGGKWFRYRPPLVYTPFWEDPLGNLGTFWIPGLIIGYTLSSVTMRVTRSAVLEVLRQDYVRTAWAKGLRERVVVSRHVLRNALIPIVTILGNQFSFILGSTVLVEIIFHLPGLGFTALEAITIRDYTQIQGTVLFLGAIIILANLMQDVAYARLDPRIRLNAKMVT